MNCIEQVWSKPMTHLAKEYGLSDNGLRKICKKLGVPLPKSGHWSKVQFGKKVDQIPLPLDPSYPETYESKPQNVGSTPNLLQQKKKIEVDPELQRIIDFENSPKNKIKVPKSINRLHPLVNQTRNSLKGESVDYKGLIWPKMDCLDIFVSPRSLNRALRIFHTIILALSNRGIKITLKHEVRRRHSCFSVWGEDIFLGIAEKISQRILTSDEIEEGKKKNKFFWATHQYTPTSKLALRVYDGETGTYCKEFVDGEKVLLESRLNEVVVCLHSLSLKLKRRKKEIEENHRIWELERQKEEAKQRRIKIENLKISLLFKLADGWNKANRLRSFVEEVREKSSPGSELDAWVVWANSQADDMDVTSGDFLDNWKWNVERGKDIHWDLKDFEDDSQA